MSAWLIGGIVLVGLVVIMASGVWIAVAMGILGVILLVFAGGGVVEMVGIAQFACVNSFTFTAVPLFVFMGEIILRSGISDKLYRGANVWVGSFPGGLLHTNIASCSLFAAICGSSVATAATIGIVAIPEMTERGYNRKLIFGSLAAGGTLGILIPPSLIMIIYGAWVEQPVAELFMAGLFPGLVLAGLFMGCIGIVSAIRPHLMPQRPRFSLRAIPSSIIDIAPILVLIVVVLGTIYLGLATPTESAALGASVALAIAGFYRRLTWQVFKGAMVAAVKLTSWVMLVVIGARILAMGLSMLRVPGQLASDIVSLGVNSLMIFALIVFLYIILGMFIEAVSMMLMTLPIIFPTAVALGWDPIWFGVVLVLMVEMAQITPPMGINLFVIDGITGKKFLSEIIAGVIPFFICVLAMVVILTAFPDLALWLPAQMR